MNLQSGKGLKVIPLELSGPVHSMLKSLANGLLVGTLHEASTHRCALNFVMNWVHCNLR